ncbi:MAG: hypothetical protein KGJ17_06585, partial [Gammaproteobacteria bacterium]|nr:hypothetical protein [Gammaproteobacteria bacterium]
YNNKFTQSYGRIARHDKYVAPKRNERRPVVDTGRLVCTSKYWVIPVAYAENLKLFTVLTNAAGTTRVDRK